MDGWMLVCGDVDSCAFDADNDADSDTIYCGNVDWIRVLTTGTMMQIQIQMRFVCAEVDSCEDDEPRKRKRRRWRQTGSVAMSILVRTVRRTS